jgi:hypothetical protein
MSYNWEGYLLAPCIISKVKHALNVPNRYKGNNKKCSYKYWVKTVTLIGDEFGLSSQQRQKGNDKFKKYMAWQKQ